MAWFARTGTCLPCRYGTVRQRTPTNWLSHRRCGTARLFPFQVTRIPACMHKEPYDRQRTDSVYLLACSAYAFLLFLPPFSWRLIVCCLGHASFRITSSLSRLFVSIQRLVLRLRAEERPHLVTFLWLDGGGSARGWRVKASWHRIERNVAKWLFFFGVREQ